eukprot:8027678-Lingulodinium_polyedra.AAC.1
MAGVGAAWKRLGVPLNEKKTVNAQPNEEFQGTVLRDRRHWLGTSVARRKLHLAATLRVLGRRS